MNDVAAESISLSGTATLVLAVLMIGYLITLTVLSVVAGRKVETEEDYLVAGRKLSLFLCWATMVATWFGAEAMTASSENARRDGLLGVVLDPLACGVTFLFSGWFFAAPLWRMKLITTSDFYRRTYGSASETLSGLIQIPSYFGWIALQYQALADVQQIYFGIPHRRGIAIAWGVTLAYTMIGGMWSVTLTESLQILISLTGLFLVAVSVFSQFGEGSIFSGIERLVRESDPGMLTLMPPAATAAMLAYCGAWATGILGNVPGQDLQQRIYSARDERTAVRACHLTGITYLCFGMIPVGLGLMARLIPGMPETGVLAIMANKFLSPPLAVFFILAFTSMVVCTSTSALLAPATILSHSLLSRWPVLKRQGVTLDRAGVFLISLGGLALTFLDRSKMELLSFSISLTLVTLFIPLWQGLYGRPRSQWCALLAMTVGLCFYLIRWLPETVVYPLPEDVRLVTAAGVQRVDFHDYLAYEIVDGCSLPRISSQETAAPPLTELPSLSVPAGILRAACVVPAEWYGLIASGMGYLLAQVVCRRSAPINDQTRKEAWGEDRNLLA